ncbi:MAG TPA: DUF6798 domain-containing protein, partial [Rhodothermales bacterium]
MPSNGHGGASRSYYLAIAAAVTSLLLHFLRFGYAYGAGDHDETLPLVLQRLDPSLYTGDWFVTGQSGEFGVRSAFVTTLATFAEVIPLWLVVALLHVATFVAVALAVHRLTRSFFGSEAAAFVTTIAALVLTPQWTLGGNDLVHGILVPSTVGWSLALWSVAFHLSGRRVRAGLFLGLATLFQALVGLQVIALVLAHVLVRAGRPLRQRSSDFVTLLLPFALVAGPLLAVLIHGQRAPVPERSAFPSLFYIMASFRAPHHYLPDSFPLVSWVKFGTLFVAGVAGVLLLRRRKELRHGDFLFVGINVLAVFLVLGYLFTEVVPVLRVTLFQPFKLTVLAKPVLLGGIVAAAIRTTRRGQRFDEWLVANSRPVTAAVLAGVVVIVLMLGATGASVGGRVGPIVHARTDLGVVEQWAARATDARSTFLVPPSNTTFRFSARRSIVVNFKSIPFEPDPV